MRGDDVVIHLEVHLDMCCYIKSITSSYANLVRWSEGAGALSYYYDSQPISNSFNYYKVDITCIDGYTAVPNGNTVKFYDLNGNQVGFLKWAYYYIE